MTVVVDASIAVAWALEPRARRAAGSQRFVAPSLLWSEASSALHTMVWRRHVTRGVGRAALARLHETSIDRTEPDDLHGEAWRVADELGWAKTYDAEYVALARMLASPLLTLDAGMRRGAGRLVEVVAPAEL